MMIAKIRIFLVLGAIQFVCLLECKLPKDRKSDKRIRFWHTPNFSPRFPFFLANFVWRDVALEYLCQEVLYWRTECFLGCTVWVILYAPTNVVPHAISQFFFLPLLPPKHVFSRFVCSFCPVVLSHRSLCTSPSNSSLAIHKNALFWASANAQRDSKRGLFNYPRLTRFYVVWYERWSVSVRWCSFYFFRPQPAWFLVYQR